jgi:putative nucleotidyltransferase with HDIG domain
MGDSKASASIFSQKLDRVAFTAYFLGAVVPLVALAVVLERYVFPEISDRYATFGLIGLLVSLAVLSLASFLTLRHTTRSSLQRIDRDNRRLAALLDVSGRLASVQHAGDAAATAARTALALTGARASFVLVRGEAGAVPVRLAAAGDEAEKLEQQLVEPLLELTKLVLSGGRPALREASRADLAMAAVPLPGEVTPAGALVAVRHRGGACFDAAEVGALATLGGLAAVALHNADLRDSQRNFFTHVTDMLIAALDAHLGYNNGHAVRVARYANRIGRQMRFDDHHLERLHFASLLHDIGMLKVERHLRMTPQTCAKHTLIGARMLGRIRLWQDLAPIVQHHHEWWDGSGYPEGLAGKEIPLDARVIAVCDAFDTITSDASYKEAIPFVDAVHEIESSAGTQFDPEVVSAFLELVRTGAIRADDSGMGVRP